MTQVGTTTVGGSFDNVADNYVWLKVVGTPAALSDVTSISLYCKRHSGTPTLAAALYSDSGGHPSSLLVANDTGVAVPSTTGWLDVPLSVRLSAGQQVWVCIRNTGFAFGWDTDFAFATNGGLVEGEFKSNASNANFPSSATGTTTFADERASVYMNVTAVPSGTINAPFIGSGAQIFGPVLQAPGTVAIPYLPDATVTFQPVVSLSTVSAPFISSTSVVRAPTLSGGVAGPGYFTAFPLTENPLSEGGVWVEGLSDGVDWNNWVSSGGHAHGSQTGNEVGAAQFADSIAVLRGTFPSDIVLESTVYSASGSGDFSAEVEHLHNFKITPHSARGLEFNISVNGFHGQYSTWVRWNGPLGDFTTLQTTFPGAVLDGAVIRTTRVGNVFSAYVNGVLVNQVTDSTFTDGNPGIGSYLHNITGSGDSSTYGFKQFAVVANQTVAVPFVASSSQIFPVVGGAVGRIDVPFIATQSVVFAPAVRTVGGETDIGLVADEGV